MAKVYWFSFSPNPSDTANLSPTFLNFAKFDGTTLAAPGITQPFTGTGLYQFTYTPTFSIAFRIDGATTGGGLTTAIRYISGSLDPIDRLDELLAEQGSTLTAMSSSLAFAALAIGSTNSVYGSSSTDPVDLFGYMKRIREFLEGSQSFNKSNGTWAIYSRSGATLLASKTLTNAASGVTRT